MAGLRISRSKAFTCVLLTLVLTACASTDTVEAPPPFELGEFTCVVIPIAVAQNLFYVDVRSDSDSWETIRRFAVVRAAEIAVSYGCRYFRIEESYEGPSVFMGAGMEPEGGSVSAAIVIRLSDEPADFDAQSILGTLGEEGPLSGPGGPAGEP